MTGMAKVLKYVAFWLVVAFGLLGGLFVVGETFDDPGGWTAVGLVALWLVPLVALSVFALLRPEMSAPVFVGVTALVAVFTLADAAFGIIPRDSWGPVAAIAVFALGVALAFLGLHQAGLAGLLMLVLVLAQTVATVLARGGHAAGFGGSSGVMVPPLLVAGALFLLAGAQAHEPLRPQHRPKMRHAL